MENEVHFNISLLEKETLERFQRQEYSVSVKYLKLLQIKSLLSSKFSKNDIPKDMMKDPLFCCLIAEDLSSFNDAEKLGKQMHRYISLKEQFEKLMLEPLPSRSKLVSDLQHYFRKEEETKLKNDIVLVRFLHKLILRQGSKLLIKEIILIVNLCVLLNKKKDQSQEIIALIHAMFKISCVQSKEFFNMMIQHSFFIQTLKSFPIINELLVVPNEQSKLSRLAQINAFHSTNLGEFAALMRQNSSMKPYISVLTMKLLCFCDADVCDELLDSLILEIGTTNLIKYKEICVGLNDILQSTWIQPGNLRYLCRVAMCCLRRCQNDYVESNFLTSMVNLARLDSSGYVFILTEVISLNTFSIGSKKDLLQLLDKLLCTRHFNRYPELICLVKLFQTLPQEMKVQGHKCFHTFINNHRSDSIEYLVCHEIRKAAKQLGVELQVDTTSNLFTVQKSATQMGRSKLKLSPAMPFRQQECSTRYLSSKESSTALKYLANCEKGTHLHQQMVDLFLTFCCSTHSSAKCLKREEKVMSDKDWQKLCFNCRLLPKELSRTDVSWVFHRSKKCATERGMSLSTRMHSLPLGQFKLALCFLYVFIANKKRGQIDSFESFVKRLCHAANPQGFQLPKTTTNRKRTLSINTSPVNLPTIKTKIKNSKPVVATARSNQQAYDENFIKSVQKRLQNYVKH